MTHSKDIELLKALNTIADLLEEQMVDEFALENGWTFTSPRKRQALISTAENKARLAELEKMSLEVIESCEPECDDVRHALHEGSWRAHLKIEKRITELEEAGE